jgi:hypothetical protein
MDFSSALLKIADDKTADISVHQRRKLKRIATNSRRCKRCEERMELEARRAKKRLKPMNAEVYGDGDTYGFDWSGLLEFLKGLLPIILAFIDALN